MNKINKQANFWLRFLSRIIDMTIILSILSIIIYFMVGHKSENYYFKENYLFYVWGITSSLTMLFITTIIPMLTKGRSIGNFVTRTKIVSNKNIIESIWKRELFFGIAWTTIIFLIMVVLTPEIFIETITKVNKSKVVLYNIDAFRFALINTITGIIIFIQFILAVSLLIKRGGNSLIDNFSKSKIIRINKFEDKPIKNDLQEEIKPKLIENTHIEWVKGE